MCDEGEIDINIYKVFAWCVSYVVLVMSVLLCVMMFCIVMCVCVCVCWYAVYDVCVCVYIPLLNW